MRSASAIDDEKRELAALLNRELSVLEGEHTGVRAGSVLRHRC